VPVADFSPKPLNIRALPANFGMRRLALMDRKDFQVGIVGAGTMGSSLAQLFAQSGFSVTVVEQNEDSLGKGLDRIHDSLAEAVKRGVFSPEAIAQFKNSIKGSTTLDDLKDCNLVIEAIFENLGAKQQLFTNLLKICSAKTLLATNTSSFRVQDLCTDPKAKERVLGLHYFYPPAKNRLLEVIHSDNASAEQRALIDSISNATGRVPIFCEDECGFVVNRFFVPWLNEAARMLDERMGDVAQINALSKREFDLGLGAFELMNLIGLAPTTHAMQTLHERFGEAYKPAQALVDQLAANKPWSLTPTRSSDGTLKIVSPTFADMRFRGVVFMAVNELIQEGVCTPADIEIGARVGLKWNFGPISRWHKLGNDKVRETLKKYFEHHKLASPQAVRSVATFDEQRRFVRLQQFKGTATIYLDRPEAMNALGLTLLKQLSETLHECLADNSVDKIVLRGVGKSFAAGGDLHFLRAAVRDSDFSDTDEYFAFAQNLFAEIDASKKPIVALVEGVAAGGGVQLALACDYIITSPEASFSFPETTLGLFPGLGGTQRLPKRIGKELAKYLFFTGTVLGAEDAASIGLVDRVSTTLDWSGVVDDVIKNQAETKRPNLPAPMNKIATLMNSKNVSRILNRKSAASLPEEMAGIYEKTKDKHTFAMQAANNLVDKSEGLNLESGLKLELNALKAICRNQETMRRLLSKKI
jgi:enoyl-CoA hydratase/3-hydroxyacyl-CoA dehydrogenase